MGLKVVSELLVTHRQKVVDINGKHQNAMLPIDTGGKVPWKPVGTS